MGPSERKPSRGSRHVSFIIPVRNDAANLKRCLASISAIQHSTAEVDVVVADNGSTDDSTSVARSAEALVMKLPGLSVAALRNRAAKQAQGGILGFVDADHEIVSSWALIAIEVLSDPTVAAVGSPCFPPPQANWVQRAYDHLRDHVTGRREVRWLGSGNLAVRRSCFEDVGGFDESLATCEDVDLCSRLRARGYRIVSDSRMASVHHGDPETLGQVFTGELWRGQNNLQVSLRNRLSLADLPSIVLPIVSLVSLVLFAVGLAVTPFGGLGFCAAGLVGLSGTIAPRTARMLRGGCSQRRAAWAGIIAVAATYDVARALALVFRAPHHRPATGS
jgi:cellulose synthase/poly-beta-1,6-N-acetylglucosamine synthase-like glycosyltransferase